MSDYTTWMSNPKIQNLTFGALKIPGTHDSGTSSLDLILSQIKYSDIAFLWNLDPGTAPADGNWPWPDGKTRTNCYVGEGLYRFIMTAVKAMAVAQDQTILEQLNGGIRYFDLRVYYDTSANDFYVQHALRGRKLAEIFAEVRQFIHVHPTSKELIILELSHTNFSSKDFTEKFTTDLTNKVAAMVKDAFGDNVFMPSGAAGKKNWNFQLLSSVKVEKITKKKPAVMLLNTDELYADKPYVYESMVINTKGFVHYGSSGVDTVPELIKREDDGLRENQKKKVRDLYGIGWVLTAQLSDVMRQIQNGVLGNGAMPILQQLALDANKALRDFIEPRKKCAFNVIEVDWYETGNNVVEICVGLNTA